MDDDVELRLRAQEGRLSALETDVGKLRAGHQRMGDAILQMSQGIENKLDVNTDLTRDIAEGLKNLRGFIKTLAWAGKGLIYIGKFIVLPFAAVGVLIYMIFNHGEVPHFWGELLKFLSGG